MHRRSLLVLAFSWSIACAPPSSARRDASSPPGDAAPEPAIPAVLAAFEHHDIVAIDAGHGQKDLDDVILALVRHPGFAAQVDDLVVECGNSRYQPILDRYIAGADVPFTEVRRVWRDTTQSMCGLSGFYAQLFPLVRAINQRLPRDERIRVLAGDPPIAWEQITTADDAARYFERDPTMASIVAREVLARRRKALVLAGTFHLLHGHGHNLVSTLERDRPGVAFVITDLGAYDSSRVASWPHASLAVVRGTWLGARSTSELWPPPVRILDCKVQPERQRRVEEVVDALLYLGPRDLRLAEPTPADVALDTAYLTELQRREALTAFPGSPPRSVAEMRDELLHAGERALLAPPPPPPDVPALEASCRARAGGHGAEP